MEIKHNINPSQYPIGVLVARFQVDELHEGQKGTIDLVCANHKKVILFLGVPYITGSKENPMDFATRRAMIQEAYPHIVVLPQHDVYNDDVKWSKNLDTAINLPFGELPALLYGNRDSFLPHYKGSRPTIELTTDVIYSGTEVRKKVASEIRFSSDFRAGVIHSVFAQRPVTYPTVDVVAYNDKGEILLAKKPNEALYRFIGGFVDRDDQDWETAAKREFVEESGGSEIGDLEYVASAKIDDWRYRNSESGITSTLFAGKFLWGKATASDDIELLKWVDPKTLNVSEDIMPEHRLLFGKLLEFLKKKNFK